MVSRSTSITFYDFLNKIVIGFLLLCVLMQYNMGDFLSQTEKTEKTVQTAKTTQTVQTVQTAKTTQTVQTVQTTNGIILQQFISDEYLKLFICFIASFILGFVFSHIVDWITYRLRIRDDMILKAKKKVEEYSSITIKIDSNKLKYNYLLCYYRLMKEGMLNNIPLLEAMEKFVRQLFILSITWMIFRMYALRITGISVIIAALVYVIVICVILHIINNRITKEKKEDSQNHKCKIIYCIQIFAPFILYILLALAFMFFLSNYPNKIIAIGVLLLLPIIWYEVQMKIYVLVWEGAKYWEDLKLQDTCYSGGHSLRCCFQKVKNRIINCLQKVKGEKG